MNGNDLNIDFSWSIQDWIAFIKEFIDVLVDFFGSIGIKLFEDDAPQGE